MSHSESERELRQPDKLVRWTIIAFSVVLLLLGVYAVYRMALRHTVKLRTQEVAEQVGQSLSLEAINESYVKPPIGQNGADVWVQAFAAYVDPSEKVSEQIPALSSTVEDPPKGEPIPPEMLAAMGKFVLANKHALELAQKAAGYEQCRYTVDLREGVDALLPHLGEMRRLARLMGTAAEWHAERGELDEAVDVLANTFALADSLKDEPVLISQLVRVSIQALGIRALDRVLARATFNDEQLARLQQVLSREPTVEQYRKSLMADLCMGLDWFDRLAQEVASYGAGPAPTIVLLRVTGLSDFDHLKYLDFIPRINDAMKQPLPKIGPAMDAIEVDMENLPIYCWITRQLLPAFGAANKSMLRVLALYRLAQMAMAVDRYRLAQGRLPETLDELTPAYLETVPLDPFDGKPLKYVPKAETYLLYSVGTDGKDDHGVSGPRYEPDIAFPMVEEAKEAKEAEE